MTNREAMEFASKNSFLALYEKGKADAFAEAWDRIDEGVCHLCEHRDVWERCIKTCDENGFEKETIMKWLKEKSEA